MIGKPQAVRVAALVCVSLVFGAVAVFAQCPAGSTCFGEVDTNSQSPSISFSGDIPGARWLMHLGDFELTFSSDGSQTQDLGTGDTIFLGNTYRPKVAFSPFGDVLVSGHIKVSGGVDAGSSGLKHARAGGCSAVNQCSVTVSWPGNAFPDTNYTAVCTPDGGAFGTLFVASKSVSGITVTMIGGFTGAGIFQAQLSGVDCIAMHD